jgi:hypothetical protein
MPAFSAARLKALYAGINSSTIQFNLNQVNSPNAIG